MNKEIHSFIWCKKCFEQNKPPRIEVGIARSGIQVWCKTHNMNVAYLSPDELAEQMNKGCQCHDCEIKE